MTEQITELSPTPVLSPSEFLNRVLAMAKRWDRDPEHAHYEVDELMEAMLVGLGYGAGIDVVRNQTRWYA